MGELVSADGRTLFNAMNCPHHHEHFAAGKMTGMRKNDKVLADPSA
jgi:hypothetical protein